ncbi:MAG: Flp family type IVb pilin [Pseudomonadota bacterium]
MLTKILAHIMTYSRDEDGATAIEYGLIAAFIALVIIGGVTVFGQQLNQLFNDMAAALGGAGGGTP